MLVTDFVSKLSISNEVKEIQFLNIQLIETTEEVSKLLRIKEFKFLHP
jgi:hypothetical protein